MTMKAKSASRHLPNLLISPESKPWWLVSANSCAAVWALHGSLMAVSLLP